jgi:hypothetical protein
MKMAGKEKADFKIAFNPRVLREFLKHGTEVVQTADGKKVELVWEEELTPDDLDELELCRDYIEDIMTDLEEEVDEDLDDDEAEDEELETDEDDDEDDDEP